LQYSPDPWLDLRGSTSKGREYRGGKGKKGRDVGRGRK